MPSMRPAEVTESGPADTAGWPSEGQAASTDVTQPSTGKGWERGKARSRPTKVSERLTFLVEETRRPDGRRWTLSYLADQLTELGQTTTKQYLGYLLDGRRENPSLALVEALADVFGVPAAYFTSDFLGRTTSELLPLLAAVRDPQVKALLNRSDLTELAADLAGPAALDDPAVQALMGRTDLPEVARSLLDKDLLMWVGSRPLPEVLDTLRAPVVQSAIEETLANWLKYGTGSRK